MDRDIENVSSWTKNNKTCSELFCKGVKIIFLEILILL